MSTACTSASGADELHEDAFYAVLPLVLAHSPLCHDQQTVIQLLAVSQEVRSAAHKHLSSRVSIQCKLGCSDQQAFVPWLKRHGNLLKSLDLGRNEAVMQDDSYCTHWGSKKIMSAQIHTIAIGQQIALDTLLIDAFQHLATTSGSAAIVGHQTAVRSNSNSTQGQSCSTSSKGLRLQELRATIVNLHLLKYLPRNTLSSLTLYWCPLKPQDVQHMLTALQRLSKLKQLEVHLPCLDNLQSTVAINSSRSATDYSSNITPPLDMILQPPFIPQAPSNRSSAVSVPSTSSHNSSDQIKGVASSSSSKGVRSSVLLHLRSLKLSGRFNLEVLTILPPSLEQLDLHLYSYRVSVAGREHWLDLSYLTALTQLKLSSCAEGVAALFQEDILPPNLRKLEVSDFEGINPILSIQQLQLISLVATQCSPIYREELVHITTNLTSLTELRLQYCCSYFLEDSADVWGKASHVLRDLRVDLRRSDPSCIAKKVVQQLAQCTGLTRLDIQEVGHLEATAEAFADVLSKLQRLQQLTLRNVCLWSKPGVPDSTAAQSPVLLEAIKSLPHLTCLKTNYY